MMRGKKLSLSRVSRCFTLIEVMIAISLLLLLSGLIAHRMMGAMDRKRFLSDVDRIKARMVLVQKMAMTTHADWVATVKKEGEEWVFHVECREMPNKKLKPLRLAQGSLSFNHRPIRKEMTFDFFSTGHTHPEGVLSFEKHGFKEVFKTKELFLRKEGEKGGPQHPSAS